jgi:glycogen(starch) synthase
MRILHLTDHYLPALGGIETHVAALASRQAARGDDVTVLTSTAATADGRRSDDAGPVAVRRVRSVSEGLEVDFSS